MIANVWMKTKTKHTHSTCWLFFLRLENISFQIHHTKMFCLPETTFPGIIYPSEFYRVIIISSHIITIIASNLLLKKRFFLLLLFSIPKRFSNYKQNKMNEMKKKSIFPTINLPVNIRRFERQLNLYYANRIQRWTSMLWAVFFFNFRWWNFFSRF